MGKYFNYLQNEDNLIDNKKEPTYTSDLETGTLIEDGKAINDDFTIKIPKLKNVKASKPSFKINKPNIKIPKSIYKFLFLIPVLLIIAGVISYQVIKTNHLKNYDVTKTDAFFIETNDGSYLLFNENGKKLSSNSFKSVSNFINNTALVINSDNNYGIINNKGKMVVKYDKFKYIFSEGPLYFLTDYETDYYLINAKGKAIYQEIGFEIINFSNNYVLLKKGNNFKLLNYNGKVITSFKDKNLEEIPSISEKNDYITLYYDNNIEVYNIKTFKKLTSFKSRERFCITDTNKDNLIIYACDSVGDILEPYSYRVIINKKIKYDLVFNEDPKPRFDGNLVVYTKNGEEYLINDSGNNVTKTLNATYYDYDKYAKLNDAHQVDVYYHDKLKRTVDCKGLSTGSVTNKIYLFKQCGDNNRYQYYNLKGKKISSYYDDALPFNNDIAIVKENDNYYLINKKFKKISSGYSSITYTNVGNYYLAYDGNKKVILNNKGKEIVSGTDIKLLETKTNLGYMALIDNINAYVVYNLTKGKEITTIVNEPMLSEHYFYVSKIGKTYYYSYKNGHIFYSK